MTAATVTIFSSPTSQQKRFKLDGNTLIKEPPASAVVSAYRPATYTSANELVDLLVSLKPNETLCPGVPRQGAPESGPVVLKAVRKTKPGSIARFKPDWRHHEGPGLVVLDYDPQPGKEMTQEALFQSLLTICPQLAHAPVVGWYSASSFIYNGEQELAGARGQRIYLTISTATDIKRTIQVINQRLALNGHGHGLDMKVTEAGTICERFLFDEVFAQPTRLDYAPAGADCQAPLTSKRPAPTILAHGPQPLDSRVYLPDLSDDEEATFKTLVANAKRAVAAEAAAKKAARIEAGGEAAAQRAVARKATAEEISAAREAGRQEVEAALAGTLTGDFQVTLDDGKTVTVSTILADRKKYHERACLDPLNPQHRNGAADAIIYSSQPHPIIYSLDDGGITYRLAPQRQTVTIINGQGARVADEIAQAIVDGGRVYNLGDCAVLAPGFALGSNAKPENLRDFRRLMAGHSGLLSAPYVALVKPQGKGQPMPADFPGQMQADVLTLVTEKAPRITGQARHPVVTPKGEVIDQPGYNAKHGIFLHFEPGQFDYHFASLNEAMQCLWHFMGHYKWETPDDKAAVLAAILGVVMRPLLDKMPGIFMDAPDRGSGKTSAATAIACLILGHRPAVQTVPNEDEIEKRLCAAAVAGSPVVFFDNVTGEFQSEALAANITSGRLTSRILRSTAVFDGAFRPLILATGNNADLHPDMAQRLLLARIDPDDTATYPFEPDDAALANRDRIIAAIVYVLREFFAAGAPRPARKPTRFAQWEVVRDCVTWLVQQGVFDCGDCAASILEVAMSLKDEARAGLLLTLRDRMGLGVFQAAQVCALIQGCDKGYGDLDLWNAIRGVREKWEKVPTPAALGRMFDNERGKKVAGLKLVKDKDDDEGKKRKTAAFWKVIDV